MSKKKLDELGVSAFCESMAMMIKSGIQTDEAVALLQSESGSHGVLSEGLRYMKEQLESGSTFTDAMKGTDGSRACFSGFRGIMPIRKRFPKKSAAR